MTILLFLTIVCAVVSLVMIATDNHYYMGGIGWCLLALAVCFGFFALIEADTNSEEKACRDKGGEVVNSGQYGTIVNCINVPK